MEGTPSGVVHAEGVVRVYGEGEPRCVRCEAWAWTSRRAG